MGRCIDLISDLYTYYSCGSIALGSLAICLPGTARWSPGWGDSGSPRPGQSASSLQKPFLALMSFDEQIKMAAEESSEQLPLAARPRHGLTSPLREASLPALMWENQGKNTRREHKF